MEKDPQRMVGARRSSGEIPGYGGDLRWEGRTGVGILDRAVWGWSRSVQPSSITCHVATCPRRPLVFIIETSYARSFEAFHSAHHEIVRLTLR